MQLNQTYLDKILRMEGGYQNSTADDGNLNACGNRVGTKYGITPGAAQDYLYVNCPTLSYMQNLTHEQAATVYAAMLKRYRVYQLDSQVLGELHFNNVIMNPKNAIKSLQRACNRFGANLAVDGKIGTRTIAATNDLAYKDLVATYNALLEEWRSYLSRIGNATYHQGWQNRMANNFPPLQYTPTEPQPTEPVLAEVKAVEIIKINADHAWNGAETPTTTSMHRAIAILIIGGGILLLTGGLSIATK